MTESILTPLQSRVRQLLMVVMAAAAALFVVFVIKGPLDGAGDPADGMWGAKTASVNWCERDYAVTPWIAEFGNAFSSFFIVAYGIWGVLAHRNQAWLQGPGIESRFPLAFTSFIVVGLGSFLFHATLLRSMQLLDELPMIWANSVFIYILVQMEQPCELDGSLPEEAVQPYKFRKILLGLGLSLATAGMSTAVTLFDSDDQNVFLLCYGSGLAFIVLRSMKLNREYNYPGLEAIRKFFCYAESLSPDRGSEPFPSLPSKNVPPPDSQDWPNPPSGCSC